ncbi:GNAT family N-acetyltransferase [Streptococcus sp. 27098_8_22]|uniref:GNAT family N-acetyltransferase n=1 Tax=Streptococcus sp. 27098_8_22 TaxID=3003665 RepID=UPI00352D19FD
MEFPIKIREAQQSDIDQICLIQESISSSLEILNRKIIEERIRNHAGTFLLASLDDQGIAYITATILPFPSLRKWMLEIGGEKFINENSIILEDLAVHPDYQGQGFGTLLLAALKEVTRQQDRLGIYLLCEDELLAYFEMNGFVEQGIVDGERSSEVAFLMRWQNPYY